MSLQPVNLNGDVGVRPLVVAVIFIVLATVSVVLRYVSRRMMKAPLAADDYLICLALVSPFHFRKEE